MKIKASILALTLPWIISCATLFPAEVIHEKDGVTTLWFNTGELGEDLYDSNFQAGAAKKCGSKGYEVLEKSFNPSTLKHYKIKNRGTHYWVIKCNK